MGACHLLHDMRVGAEREIGRIEEQIARLRGEIQERRAGQISRDELLETLTARFREILRDFGFPKLDDPHPPISTRTSRRTCATSATATSARRAP